MEGLARERLLVDGLVLRLPKRTQVMSNCSMVRASPTMPQSQTTPQPSSASTTALASVRSICVSSPPSRS
jgi:hypothetical protein